MSCSECAPYGLPYCPMCRPDPVVCPKCDGFGITDCTAFSIRGNKVIEVSTETYLCLPDNEKEAKEKGKNYFKGDYYQCSCCKGTGEIYPDENEERL